MSENINILGKLSQNPYIVLGQLWKFSNSVPKILCLLTVELVCMRGLILTVMCCSTHSTSSGFKKLKHIYSYYIDRVSGSKRRASYRSYNANSCQDVCHSSAHVFID